LLTLSEHTNPRLTIDAYIIILVPLLPCCALYCISLLLVHQIDDYRPTNCIMAHFVREYDSHREQTMELSNGVVCTRDELDVLIQVEYIVDFMFRVLLYNSVRFSMINIWAANGCGLSKYDDAGEMALPPGRIVGGIEARPNEFPWQVFETINFHSHFPNPMTKCTNSLA